METSVIEETVTSTGTTTDFHGQQETVRVVGFARRSDLVNILQVTVILLLCHVKFCLFKEGMQFFGSKVSGISLSQERKELVLLTLVVEHSPFLAVCTFELSSDQRVAYSNANCP